MTASEGKRLLLAVFRLGTLSLALIELGFDDSPQAYLADVPLAIIALSYTVFKLIHPFRWYASRLRGIALITIDVMVCAFLLFMPREIHTPFALYSLNPVLSSALLFPVGVTWITGGVSAIFYTSHFVTFNLTDFWQHLSSMFFPQLVALGLISWLPYVINSHVQQRERARAILEERLKLGRELHDGLCQTIYGLNLELQVLRRNINLTEGLDERLARLKELLDKAEKEARGSIELLRSFNTDHSFLPQLEDSLRHLDHESGIGYRLDATQEEPHMDDLVKLEVLYICEEALRNVAKHSRATQVTVRVRASNGYLRISIADDGRGMALDGPAKGHGLNIMKERVESLGGRFQIISSPGAGTEIRLEVPRKCS